MKVIQEGFKDCGPACLLMIIKHYKGNIPINKLKEMCNTSTSGTTAYDLINAAKRCGFESHGYKCELKDLNSLNIKCPFIAYVVIDNMYKHYVVVDKINFKTKKIHIKDPIGKEYYMGFDDFIKIFKNIIIHAYPIQKVINIKSISFYKYIYDIILPSINEIKQFIIISIFVTLFSMITAFYMQFITDSIPSNSKVNLIFLFFILISILKIVSIFIRNKLIMIINQKIDLNLNFETFKNIIHLPYHFYSSNTVGEIVSRMNDLDVIRNLISKVISLFIDIPMTLISLILIYFINSKLFFMTLIIILIYILIILLFNKTINNKIDEYKDLKAFSTSYMVEAINSYNYFKGCNKEEKIISKYESKYVSLLNKVFDLENTLNKENLFKNMIDEFGFLFIILFGVHLIINNNLTLSSLLTINFLFSYSLEPIKNIIELIKILNESIISIRKVINLYEEEKHGGVISTSIKGDINIKNLSYSYNDKEVLKCINLNIKQGEKVMITGNSGSGKSTLAKILKGYYKVDRNKIDIDNIDINDYMKNDIIYISQKEILFTDTIINNIGGNIKKLSKICLLDDIINKNELGYNTLIEEGGFNISGGEQQRIVLARALNNDFNILILDEALNQVDIISEAKILNNLFKEYKNSTIIYISHRLDNKNIFDKVLNLKDGVIDNL